LGFAGRYNSFSRHLKAVFGCSVYKIPVDAGFTCPNRDGTLGTGGCIFCDKLGSGADSLDRTLSLAGQIRKGKESVRKRFNAEKFLVYFQAFTNTYAPLQRLASLYEEALGVEGVVGLAIGTRADCLPEDVVEYLAGLSRKTYLWVEVGLQSSKESTLAGIHRGHDLECFRRAAGRLVSRGLQVCAHVIFGLPGETRRDMLNTVQTVRELGIRGIKFHPLHVLKGSGLEERYLRNGLKVLDAETYVSLVADSIERLPPDVVIHRLTANRPPDILVAPAWVAEKTRVLRLLDAELQRRNTVQGAKCAQF
jgi:radical SAM protein (TIGR01212 family)